MQRVEGKTHNREMNQSIAITFGEPEHGWLPVDFSYRDFRLHFTASDVLNDPMAELYSALVSLDSTAPQNITWWLEPEAYFFELEKEASHFSLTITETENLHNGKMPKRQLIKITGTEKEIIAPLRISLKQFSAKTHDKKHWPFDLKKDNVDKL
ncbi:hypothetical protein [Flavobacterium sp.]|uniref:hypothetical protein n=1 Tax=Flavobacterium sp. TaxID=239 RepID=UPI0039E4854D